MANPKKTQELTLKLIKGHEKYYKYTKPQDLIAYELFFNQVCRKKKNEEGNQVPVVDKQGNPIFYQLQYFLDSETDTLSEEHKKMLLDDPRFKDAATGKTKVFPYKILLSVVRVQTEADNKEWLKVRWSYEGLRRDKQIEISPSLDDGIYDHPVPETRLVQTDPKDKDSPYKSVIVAINHQPVHDIPFTQENYERELAKRSAPRDEKHIAMLLQRIGPSGIRYPHVLQVLDKEQFLARPFNEIWDYLASAPLKDTSKTEMGKEKEREKNKQYG
jgi:hypothetical protein